MLLYSGFGVVRLGVGQQATRREGLLQMLIMLNVALTLMIPNIAMAAAAMSPDSFSCLHY